jgi:hypothetical protein
MGINTFNISAEREALELTCDSPSHRDNALRAWFDCGSPSGSTLLAVGWKSTDAKAQAHGYARVAPTRERRAPRLARTTIARRARRPRPGRDPGQKGTGLFLPTAIVTIRYRTQGSPPKRPLRQGKPSRVTNIEQLR